MNPKLREILSIRPTRPAVIAHRGLSSIYPENTMPSFDAAVQSNADCIELDFYSTSDGQIVCVHDDTLRRYLDPVEHERILDRPINSYALDNLATLDVGRWKDPRFAGTTIPALGAVLDRHRTSFFVIERKAGTPEETIALLEKHDAMDRIVLQAFDWDYLTACHALAPELPLVALGRGTDLTNQLDAIAATGATGVHWNGEVSSSDMASAHQRNLPVWIYTLNTELLWRGAMAMLVDGITTDRCDALTQLLKKETRTK